MRIRLSLTLHITRDRESSEPSETFESQGSLVERAEPHPLGFTREPQWPDGD